MTDPQQLRAIVAAWWEDTFVNDYVIDRGGNYRNAEDCIEDIVVRARAALAEVDEPAAPAPPADGVMAELVSKLQRLCADLDYDDRGDDAGCCYRAAELLQLQALVPVSVSERLPGPGACDAEGMCWWWHPSHPESGYSKGWMLRPRAWGVGHYDLDDRPTHTHWLPAHALPIPHQQETNNG